MVLKIHEKNTWKLHFVKQRGGWQRLKMLPRKHTDVHRKVRIFLYLAMQTHLIVPGREAEGDMTRKRGRLPSEAPEYSANGIFSPSSCSVTQLHNTVNCASAKLLVSFLWCWSLLTVTLSNICCHQHIHYSPKDTYVSPATSSSCHSEAIGLGVSDTREAQGSAQSHEPVLSNRCGRVTSWCFFFFFKWLYTEHGSPYFPMWCTFSMVCTLQYLVWRVCIWRAVRFAAQREKTYCRFMNYKQTAFEIRVFTINRDGRN